MKAILFNAIARVYNFRILILVNVVLIILIAVDIRGYVSDNNPVPTEVITPLVIPCLNIVHHTLTYVLHCL